MATGLVNQWMQRALALAARGEGYVEPNPLVGCVLVGGTAGIGANDEALLGEGYHARFGQAHAERAALEDARQRGHAARLVGATAYVTLEPCCHHGKTPPCTAALIEAGIARVVTAQLDPFPQVAGQGSPPRRRSERRGRCGTVGCQAIVGPLSQAIKPRTPLDDRQMGHEPGWQAGNTCGAKPMDLLRNQPRAGARAARSS
ncbi:MAG: bifunctional diaminohydroxyphosphoribosylaminopyrimidine deaminase/5-amino-6-(5-phosphoribosylamino)uracil reductase RibD [Pirellulaceae bacterium]